MAFSSLAFAYQSMNVPGAVDANGKDHNGMSSFQMVTDAMDLENAPKFAKTGLIYQEKVRKNYDTLKAVIKNGGK